MLPELGHFALILALLLAGLQAFFGIAGPALRARALEPAVTPAVAGQFVMVATAVVCLVNAFVSNDFSVLYVAENSNSALPLFYRVDGAVGRARGLAAAVDPAARGVDAGGGDRARRSLPPHFAARVLGVLGVVSFGFLLFTLATSNPFLRLIRRPPTAAT